MATTPRGQVQTQGTTPAADVVSGAPGTLTGTERGKLQSILDIRSLAAYLIMSGTQLTIRLATAALDGLMSAADKAKLDAATNANVGNAIVRRDGAGGFSAGTITATLNGNAATATSATTAGSATTANSATTATTASNATSFNGRFIVDLGVQQMLPGANATFAHGRGQELIVAYGQFHTLAEHPSAYETHIVGHSVNAVTGEVSITGSDTSNVYVHNGRSDTVYVHILVIG